MSASVACQCTTSMFTSCMQAVKYIEDALLVPFVSYFIGKLTCLRQMLLAALDQTCSHSCPVRLMELPHRVQNLPALCNVSITCRAKHCLLLPIRHADSLSSCLAHMLLSNRVHKLLHGAARDGYLCGPAWPAACAQAWSPAAPQAGRCS